MQRRLFNDFETGIAQAGHNQINGFAYAREQKDRGEALRSANRFQRSVPLHQLVLVLSC